jgi:hypothetical protein
MSAGKKLEIVTLVNRSPLPKRRTLLELGMPRSTFYRGQKRLRAEGEAGLVDRHPQPGAGWNRLRPAEQESILAEALRQPELSPRELAFYVSDHARLRGLGVDGLSHPETPRPGARDQPGGLPGRQGVSGEDDAPQ